MENQTNNYAQDTPSYPESSSGIGTPVLEMDTILHETEKKSPGLKPEAAKEQQPEVKLMNPALKYGRRMDYKTAKVNDKQTVDLKLSMNAHSSAAPRPQAATSEKPSVAMASPNPSAATTPAKPPVMTTTAKPSVATTPAKPLGLSQPSDAMPEENTQIPNPLPTPKKRVPREMEYDIEPSEHEMHFDLVDLHGKDFFDIN